MTGSAPDSVAGSGEGPHLLVTGGGHAGVEAALAILRAGAASGATVTLITLDPRAIGRLSCNPSIGGLGKGQLVREIDALGGLMGVAADAAATQFRMLNGSKGPAVASPRAQVDRELYAATVSAAVAGQPRLRIVTGQVAAPVLAHGRFAGFRLTDGRLLAGTAGVLTTGTFLRGCMHVGEQRSAGGRVDEAPAAALSAALSALGLQLLRLKTGTPPRIDLRSVNLDALPRLHGDPADGRFSFRVVPPAGRSAVPSWITRTNAAVHALVREHLHLSPYGRGALEGRGPRYCPSLEDKLVRFAEKDSHRIIIERETRDGHSLYLNGLSMCLPAAVQERIVAALPGLESARMLRPGYAVEYDAVPAWQLQPTLECRALPGLFLAGQINGTSGYEEAAAQGLLAGVNALRSALGLPGAILSRSEAYIGVLIDDLVSSSPTEPYRMFTSRAEHRLVLRQDNADRRCLPRAHAWELVDEEAWQAHCRREQRLSAATSALGAEDGPVRRALRAGQPLAEAVARHPHGLRALAAAGLVADAGALRLDAEDCRQVELDLTYAGHVERARRMLQRVAELGELRLPAELPAVVATALSAEARQSIERLRPADLGRASRLAGVTPADVQILALGLGRTPGRAAGQAGGAVTR